MEGPEVQDWPEGAVLLGRGEEIKTVDSFACFCGSFLEVRLYSHLQKAEMLSTERM